MGGDCTGDDAKPATLPFDPDPPHYLTRLHTVFIAAWLASTRKFSGELTGFGTDSGRFPYL